MTLDEQVVLLSIDARGHFPEPWQTDCAAAGALLLELALAGRLDVDDHKVVVADRTPVGSAVLEDVLAVLAASSAKRATPLPLPAGRKRKSDPKADEAEDGGRAIAIEEGISALVFSYAARHDYFENVRRIDYELLQTIASMTSHLEVSVLRAADWEQAIMTGYAAWRQLRGQGGGTLHLDLDQQALRVES